MMLSLGELFTDTTQRAVLWLEDLMQSDYAQINKHIAMKAVAVTAVSPKDSLKVYPNNSSASCSTFY
ncbi:MAG: hypothetical protein V4649_18205 [Bacteroidota bacterium]